MSLRSKPVQDSVSVEIVAQDDAAGTSTELRILRRSGRYYFRYTHTRDVNGKKVMIASDAVGEVYTVFTKDASCGRGDYADEIDVEVAPRSSKADVKRVAEAAIKAHYVDGLRIARCIRREGIWF